MMKNITVLFENDLCLVLNKPAGLAVQGGKGVGASLDAILASEYSPRPLLVHRLDKDTSGVILTAKTKEAAALFGQLFTRSRNGPEGLRKIYLAVCAGKPEKGEGTITDRVIVHGLSKEARTRYKVLESGSAEFSLLELELDTGRMHQIRRHLAGLGCPILGDDKYGDFALNRKLRKDRGLRKLLLHASRLVIPAWVSGRVIDVTAPLPEYFQAYVSPGLI
jgi:23S rRNA pseudouridine955/2504/2580 synthase